MTTIELMLEALKRLRYRDNWRISQREKEELGDKWVSAEEQGLKAIAAGEAELKREPVKAGFMVWTEDYTNAAMYPLSAEDKAYDAAKRWNASICAVVVHPDAPTPMTIEETK